MVLMLDCVCFWQVDIRDIEQLVSIGEELNACPYYGTRLAVPPAQVRHRTLHLGGGSVAEWFRALVL